MIRSEFHCKYLTNIRSRRLYICIYYNLFKYLTENYDFFSQDKCKIIDILVNQYNRIYFDYDIQYII